MFGWLRQLFMPRAPAQHPLAGLAFNNAEDFFAYQCRYGDNEPRENHPCYGIVEGDVTDLAASTTGIAGVSSFERVIAVRLADASGGHTTFVPHHVRNGVVRTGDLVAWLPVSHHPAIGWQGALIAKCNPSFGAHGVEVDEWLVDRDDDD
jgi:hypothetical protein